MGLEGAAEGGVLPIFGYKGTHIMVPIFGYKGAAEGLNPALCRTGFRPSLGQTHITLFTLFKAARLGR